MTTTPREALPWFQVDDLHLYPGATVTVYLASDDSEATLYDAASGTGTLLNPQTLDSRGKFAQSIYVDVPVYAVVDAVHAPDHTTAVFRPATYVKASGATADRPTLGADDIGYEWFDTDLGFPVWWDGTDWLDATGASA